MELRNGMEIAWRLYGNGMEVVWKWHGSFPEPATVGMGWVEWNEMLISWMVLMGSLSPPYNDHL